MKTEYFKNIKEHLETLGFKSTRLPWRMESDRLSIVQVRDNNDFTEKGTEAMYSITPKRYDDSVYRGRLETPEIVNLILELTYEI